ncbi:MAG: transcription antitermination factor NusB [Planctomycetota bacterium]
MSTRRRAREIVLQLLYEEDMNGSRPEDEQRQFLRSRLQGRTKLIEFAWAIFIGTMTHRDDLDQRIEKLATNWRVSRMAVTDRNLLRMGAYEILHGDTPRPVAISEAVSLSHRYGGKDSPRFVNGVLDKLGREEAA